MPKVTVNGKVKHFPYTAAGMKMAAEARMMSKKEMNKMMGKKKKSKK